MGNVFLQSPWEHLSTHHKHAILGGWITSDRVTSVSREELMCSKLIRSFGCSKDVPCSEIELSPDDPLWCKPLPAPVDGIASKFTLPSAGGGKLFTSKLSLPCACCCRVSETITCCSAPVPAFTSKLLLPCAIKGASCWAVTDPGTLSCWWPPLGFSSDLKYVSTVPQCRRHHRWAHFPICLALEFG